MAGLEQADQSKRQRWLGSRDFWMLGVLAWLETACGQQFVRGHGWGAVGSSLIAAACCLLASRQCKPISGRLPRRLFWLVGIVLLVLQGLTILYGPPYLFFWRAK